MSAQANFVRVRIDRLAAPEGEGGDGGRQQQPPRAELLCFVRALLKKIKQTVLVGDRVRVGGIDWVDGRGARRPASLVPGCMVFARLSPG